MKFFSKFYPPQLERPTFTHSSFGTNSCLSNSPALVSGKLAEPLAGWAGGPPSHRAPFKLAVSSPPLGSPTFQTNYLLPSICQLGSLPTVYVRPKLQLAIPNLSHLFPAQGAGNLPTWQYPGWKLMAVGGKPKGEVPTTHTHLPTPHSLTRRDAEGVLGMRF